MPSRRQLTQEIDRSPSGLKVAACFDVDRTLLAGFSAVALMKDKMGSGGFSVGVATKELERTGW